MKTKLIKNSKVSVIIIMGLIQTLLVSGCLSSSPKYENLGQPKHLQSTIKTIKQEIETMQEVDKAYIGFQTVAIKDSKKVEYFTVAVKTKNCEIFSTRYFYQRFSRAISKHLDQSLSNQQHFSFQFIEEDEIEKTYWMRNSILEWSTEKMSDKGCAH